MIIDIHVQFKDKKTISQRAIQKRCFPTKTIIEFLLTDIVVIKCKENILTLQFYYIQIEIHCILFLLFLVSTFPCSPMPYDKVQKKTTNYGMWKFLGEMIIKPSNAGVSIKFEVGSQFEKSR